MLLPMSSLYLGKRVSPLLGFRVLLGGGFLQAGYPGKKSRASSPSGFCLSSVCATPWSTALSSNVDLPHAIEFKAIRGARLVTNTSKPGWNESRVLPRVNLSPNTYHVPTTFFPLSS